MVTTEFLDILARLHTLEKRTSILEDAAKFHDEALNSIAEQLIRRVTKLEKSIPTEWIRPSAKVDYVDITEGSDDIFGEKRG